MNIYTLMFYIKWEVIKESGLLSSGFVVSIIFTIDMQ